MSRRNLAKEVSGIIAKAFVIFGSGMLLLSIMTGCSTPPEWKPDPDLCQGNEIRFDGSLHSEFVSSMEFD